MYYKTKYKSKLGNLILVASKDSLIGLWIEGQKYEFQTLEKKDVVDKDDFLILIEAKKWLDDYFNNCKKISFNFNI